MNSFKEKFKSWPLWLSLAALVTFVVQYTTGLDIGEDLNTFLIYLLPVLIAFGIVNNPNDRNKL